MQNLKHMAIAHNLYHEGYISLDEVDNALDTAKTAMQKSYTEHKAVQSKVKEKKEVQEWIQKYAKTRDVRNEYKAQKTDKKKAAYRAAHEDDFIIADACTRFFKAHGITKLPSHEALRNEIYTLTSQENEAYNVYREDKRRYDELSTMQKTLIELFSLPKQEKSKKKEQELE